MVMRCVILWAIVVGYVVFVARVCVGGGGHVWIECCLKEINYRKVIIVKVDVLVVGESNKPDRTSGREAWCVRP